MNHQEKLEKIREDAINLVMTAMSDDEIPPARRAEMALQLLSKQFIKETPTKPQEPVEIVFRIVDQNGNETSF